MLCVPTGCERRTVFIQDKPCCSSVVRVFVAWHPLAVYLYSWVCHQHYTNRCRALCRDSRNPNVKPTSFVINSVQATQIGWETGSEHAGFPCENNAVPALLVDQPIADVWAYPDINIDPQRCFAISPAVSMPVLPLLRGGSTSFTAFTAQRGRVVPLPRCTAAWRTMTECHLTTITDIELPVSRDWIV